MIFYVFVYKYLDDVLVYDVLCFEFEMNIWFDYNYLEFLEEICIMKKFFDEVKFEVVLKEFKNIFVFFEEK